MIPILSLRSGKKNPPAPSASKPQAKPAVVVKPEQAKKAEQPAAPSPPKPTAAAAPSPPLFDLQAHALSCLATLSFELAARSCNNQEPLSTLTEAAAMSRSRDWKTKVRVLHRRKRLCASYATRIGRNVVSAACAIGTGHKVRRRKEKAKKAAEQQAGAAKRVKTQKYQEAKRRQRQFDRRLLSRLFCFGCGCPRVVGFAGCVLLRKSNSSSKLVKQTVASENSGSKAATSTTQTPLLVCTACARRRKATALLQSLPLASRRRLGYSSVSGRVPSSFRLNWRRRRHNGPLTRQRKFATRSRPLKAYVHDANYWSSVVRSQQKKHQQQQKKKKDPSSLIVRLRRKRTTPAAKQAR